MVQANGPRTTGTSSTTPTRTKTEVPIATLVGSHPAMATASTIPLTREMPRPAIVYLWEACSMSSWTTRLIPSSGVSRAARRAGTATPRKETPSPKMPARTNGVAVICKGGSDESRKRVLSDLLSR